MIIYNNNMYYVVGQKCSMHPNSSIGTALLTLSKKGLFFQLAILRNHTKTPFRKLNIICHPFSPLYILTLYLYINPRQSYTLMWIAIIGQI